MGSDLYFTGALALGLFACSGSSGVDGASGKTTDAGTDTGEGPQNCGGDALTETYLGDVVGTSALVADGVNLFYTAVPDASDGDTQGKPRYVAMLPTAGGTPVTLLTSTHDMLRTIRVDQENVYSYTEESQFTKVPRAGGMPTSIGVSGEDSLLDVEEFAIDATSIFYSHPTSLYKMSKQGGKGDFLYDKSNNGSTLPNILVDGDDLYFVGHPFPMDPSDAGVGQADVVYRMNKGGDLPTKVTQLTSDKSLGESIWQLAVDGDTLVFSAIANDHSTIDVAIYTVPKSGGTPAKLVTHGGPAFAAQGGTVYYSDYTSLKKVPVSGGTPVDLGVRAPDGASAMSLDATNLYWARSGCIHKTTR